MKPPALTAMLPSTLVNLLLFGGSPAFAQQPAPAPQPAPAQSPLAADAERDATPEQIAALEKSLHGCTLVGQFTVDGKGDVRPSAERYELSSVKHLQGNIWLITARIKYGDHDLTVPLPLPIRWAGNTPVITLDDFTVPGMGTYSARVMIYDDRYMGYWSATDHGGYLFGDVVRPGDEEKPPRDGEVQADEPADAAK
jgi:hypothetical protein